MSKKKLTARRGTQNAAGARSNVKTGENERTFFNNFEGQSEELFGYVAAAAGADWDGRGTAGTAEEDFGVSQIASDSGFSCGEGVAGRVGFFSGGDDLIEPGDAGRFIPGFSWFIIDC